MIYNSKTKVIEEIRVPKFKKWYEFATVIVKFEDGQTMKATLKEPEYKMNKFLNAFRLILKPEQFDALVEAISDYGQLKYGEGGMEESAGI